MDIYDLKTGDSPLIISAPHAGTYVPDEILFTFTEEGKDLADTDWYVDKLHKDFALRNDATFIRANYSRYVIDLNRPPNNEALYPGQAKVPLCPDFTFKEKPIYREGHAPDGQEVNRRLHKYWTPYHSEVAKQIKRVKDIHGFAVLYDAHSIEQSLSLLFEGELPDLNIGTANGTSCSPAVEQSVMDVIKDANYSHVLNGRFIGGYITRHHGDPENNVHAVQMEIVRSLYMDEEGFVYRPDRAAYLIETLEAVLNALTHHSGARVVAEAVS